MPTRALAVVAPWRWWAGFLFIAAVASYLTVLAYYDELPRMFHVVFEFDKVAHFVTAGLLAFFLDGALKRRTLFTMAGVPVPLAAVLVIVPTGIEEYLQRYTIHRTSSGWDFAADVAGVIAFIPLSRRSAR
jgi:hypothetical protein